MTRGVTKFDHLLTGNVWAQLTVAILRWVLADFFNNMPY